MYNNSNRIAYIIGNNNYEYLNPLYGPVNDANMMEQALKKCGFLTYKYNDLNYDDFREKVNEFKHNCIEYDAGLFYFAGHGFEYQGENYLCPIDSQKDSLEETNINISGLVNEISKDINFVSIVILDCCRDTCTKRNRGSVFVNDMIPNFKNTGGTYVAYATTTGESAIEKGGHGIYTQSLCKHITEVNKQIEQVFKNVRKDIIDITILDNKKVQIPWEYSSLVNEFYFVKKMQFDNISALAKNAIDNSYQLEQIKQDAMDYCENNNIEEQNNTIYEVLNKIDEIIGG
ncbi:caspase family protein [Clostridium gasigenes]|uniref:caspase family protein n=1 Tax=Clostridium gasigenes TaxID=94869 RepID=UPI001C0B9B17|nr:caspase family protein [Clostridium gasigenes]MBU3105145.1 caspase family protein [Clostridium gasigenes]